MFAFTTKSLTRAVLLLGLVALAAACVPPPVQQTTVQPAPVVYQAPVYQAPAPVATTYVPQYYQGNVVYFDTRGYPFYYLNGVQSYVPDSCTCYLELINHYRSYSAGYADWYAREGAALINVGLGLGLNLGL